jgi:Leucine-rich repeat (LRR) protein
MTDRPKSSAHARKVQLLSSPGKVRPKSAAKLLLSEMPEMPLHLCSSLRRPTSCPKNEPRPISPSGCKALLAAKTTTRLATCGKNTLKNDEAATSVEVIRLKKRHIRGKKNKKLDPEEYNTLGKIRSKQKEHEKKVRLFELMHGLENPNAPREIEFHDLGFNYGSIVVDFEKLSPKRNLNSARSTGSGVASMFKKKMVLSVEEDSIPQDSTAAVATQTAGSSSTAAYQSQNTPKSDQQLMYEKVMHLPTVLPIDVAYAAGYTPSTREARDKRILIKFFSSMRGHDWKNSDKWSSLNSPLKEWFGITLQRLTGAVFELVLRKNNLVGRLPLIFSHLRHLEVIDLSYNGIYGPLHDSLFCKMKNLQIISLQGNNLSGELSPAFFISLPNLIELWLSENNFSGEIPSISIEITPNLSHLCLANNKFSGEIPENISLLSNLTCLVLSHNNFSGHIPEKISNLTKLTQVSLHNNQFSGPFPHFLNQLPRLKDLHLFHNNFD